MEDPYEDFATMFALYFMREEGFRYWTDVKWADPDTILADAEVQEKYDVLDAFFATLGA